MVNLGGEKGLNEDEQRTEILRYFAKVSQDFQPLQRGQLPEEVQEEMNKHIKREHQPFIDTWTMWQSLGAGHK